MESIKCKKCNKEKKPEGLDPTLDGTMFCHCGRPTLYSEEMLQKTREYLANCTDIDEDKEHGIKQKVNLPTVEGLAYELGVNKTTIYEWESNHEEFSNELGKLKAKQAKQLINKGLSGEYSPVITKLLLSSAHGFRESQDITSDGKAIKGNGIVFSNFKDNE